MDDQANPQAQDSPVSAASDSAVAAVQPAPPVTPAVPPVTPPDPPPNPTPAPSPAVPFEKADARLLSEIAEFRTDSEKRYRFNNFWDIVFSIAGMVLSIVVVWAGFHKPNTEELIAILGALVGAVVTAQRAFPFGQRAGFYRLLIGQIRNLNTRAMQGTLSKVEVINVLSSLRMDFAQQLPRGSSDPAAASPATPSTPPPTDPSVANGEDQSK